MTQAQRTLNNRYELQAKIGDGGMAVVYRALDTQLNRIVAVKILRDTYAADPGFLARFKREAQSAASLTHPNIVNVFDVGQDGDLQYIIMEYIDGTNLKDVINRDAPLPTGQALEFGAQICDAIGFAHQHNIVHRDIKPQNILIDKSGRVKVTDFGIAKSQGDKTLTEAGVTLGTVHYFSPEQAKGLPAMPQSDLYSIGVVLYEMLTGRIPFESDNPVALAIKHIEEPPPPLRRYNPNIPTGLEQIVLKTLSKTPEQRYSTAAELSKVLRNFEKQAGQSTSAFQANPPFATGLPPRVAVQPNNPNEVFTTVNPNRPLRSSQPLQGDNNVIPQTVPQQGYNQNYAPGSYEVPGRRVVAYPGIQPSTRGYALDEPPIVEDYDQRRGPGCGAWLLGLAALAILLAIGLFFLFVLGPQLSKPAASPTPAPTVVPSPTVAALGTTNVPALVGKSQQEAENALKAANLQVGDTRQDFSTKPAKQVISQDPAPNTKVDQQTKVNLVVSKGQDLVPLPSVVNTDPNAAQDQLKALGFEVERVQESSTTIQAGAVTRTDPAGGPNVQIARGSKVRLFVSTGPPATATPLPATATPVPPTPVPATPTKTTLKVQVPNNLIGQPQQTATKALTDAGLKFNVLQWDENTVKSKFPNDPVALETYRNLKPGQVLGTDPPGGSVVDEGTTVTIAVKK